MTLHLPRVADGLQSRPISEAIVGGSAARSAEVELQTCSSDTPLVPAPESRALRDPSARVTDSERVSTHAPELGPSG